MKSPIEKKVERKGPWHLMVTPWSRFSRRKRTKESDDAHITRQFFGFTTADHSVNEGTSSKSQTSVESARPKNSVNVRSNLPRLPEASPLVSRLLLEPDTYMLRAVALVSVRHKPLIFAVLLFLLLSVEQFR